MGKGNESKLYVPLPVTYVMSLLSINEMHFYYNIFQSITGWRGNTLSSPIQPSIYHLHGQWPSINYRMMRQHLIIPIQPSIYHLHGQWPSIQLQDGGATPHHHNSTKHIPFTWSMAFNQLQDDEATPYHPNSTKHIPFTWSMAFNQLQDGGATPHHHNSTKHIPFTWSMAFNSITG